MILNSINKLKNNAIIYPSPTPNPHPNINPLKKYSPSTNPPKLNSKSVNLSTPANNELESKPNMINSIKLNSIIIKLTVFAKSTPNKKIKNITLVITTYPWKLIPIPNPSSNKKIATFSIWPLNKEYSINDYISILNYVTSIII